jgi:hypothetical protein
VIKVLFRGLRSSILWKLVEVYRSGLVNITMKVCLVESISDQHSRRLKNKFSSERVLTSINAYAAQHKRILLSIYRNIHNRVSFNC